MGMSGTLETAKMGLPQQKKKLNEVAAEKSFNEYAGCKSFIKIDESS